MCECDELKNEIVSLKQTLSQLRLEDETIQPSQTDEITRALVETNLLKVADARYEVPIPLKTDVVESFPNNYVCALNRTKTVRRAALKNTEMQQKLAETFQKMIKEGWVESVNAMN